MNVDPELGYGVQSLLGLSPSDLEMIELPFVASCNPLLDDNTGFVDLKTNIASVEIVQGQDMESQNESLSNDENKSPKSIKEKENIVNTVNASNRHEFIHLFSQHTFHECVQSPLLSFIQGWVDVVGHDDDTELRKVINELSINEDDFEALVNGHIGIDVDLCELRLTTRYDGGYTDNCTTIEWFWNTLSSLSVLNRRLFLSFVTGCDRSPIGGLKKIHLTIVKTTASHDTLPVARTCFNIIELPCYESEHELQSKLLKAIEYGSYGFGLV